MVYRSLDHLAAALTMLAIVAVSTVATACGQERNMPDVQSVGFTGPHRMGMLDKGLVDEASGIVASANHPNVYWVINDSGNEPMVYGLSGKGELVATLGVKGGKNVDWEDIAIDRGSKDKPATVFIADIGDNNAKRSEITIFAMQEPKASLNEVQESLSKEVQAATAFAYTFTYPDGARDAETLLHDPATGDLLIVTKREPQVRVYRAKAPFKNGEKRTLDFVMELPLTMITGGDISPSGNEILLKNYAYTYHWSRTKGETIEQALARPARQVRYMPEPQGEAVCWMAGGDGFVTISERPNEAYQTELLGYRRESSRSVESALINDSRPALAIMPSRDTKGVYDLRYVVNNIATVSITMHNYFMMPILVIEKGKEEAGALEREIDMIGKLAGTYIITLRAGQDYNAVALDVARD